MWKCPDCSFDQNAAETKECLGCGHVTFKALKLVSEDTGKDRILNLKSDCGCGLLQSFAGDSARYAAELQFRVYPNSEKEWILEKIPNLTNPTFHNGAEPADDQLALKDGDVISIGSRTSDKQIMKLKVHL